MDTASHMSPYKAKTEGSSYAPAVFWCHPGAAVGKGGPASLLCRHDQAKGNCFKTNACRQSQQLHLMLQACACMCVDALPRLQYGLSQKTCNLMFTRADADGNEKLTLEEMIRFTKKCYQMLVDDGDFDERMIQVNFRSGLTICLVVPLPSCNHSCKSLQRMFLRQAMPALRLEAVPAFHVVPGSCKLNALSGTRAFEMRVVR
eukprot:126018-Pelagomonas_calceolata.AAC.6